MLRGYHHGYRHGYDHGYRDGTRAGFRAGRRSVARPVQFNNINVYKNRKAGVVMSGNMCRNQVDKATVATVRPSAKPNDLYTDKQGNIYQRGQNGNWIEKSNRPTIQPSRQPEQLPPMNKPIDMSNIQRREIPQQQLTRSHQSRARGEAGKQVKSRWSSTGARSGGRR